MRYFNKDSRDFQFIEKFEAGISLNGADAKSLRLNQPQFNGSKIEVINGIPTLFNLKISKYKYAQDSTVDTTSERNLLLSQKEIAKLISLRHQKYMIIPIAIFLKGKWFKVEIGVGRKLRKYEKRAQIKAKEIKQNIL
ncbi:SsrA-binding protein [bioreactor metagenome]|uniref:SsrA-binding protein n=1 Tax=bioreactor metagenome TaxID=1076179 RepID=A0A645A543_9ZZZZ